MTNAVTVSAPGTGSVGVGLAVSGTVTPAADVVSLQLAQQNTTLPSGAWTPATTSAGTFSGVLVPPAAGTWYAWAWDQITGLSAVSAAVSVPNPLLPLVPASPLSVEQGADLLGTVSAGVTVDTIQAGAACSDTDVFLSGQGTKSLFAQPLSALWTYIQGKLPGYFRPDVTISINTNLTNSAHNGCTLIVTSAGLTITTLVPSLGAGMTCRIINISGGPVTLSGFTGVTSIASGTASAPTFVNVECFTASGSLVVMASQ
jgi:hypothetical protein